MWIRSQDKTVLEEVKSIAIRVVIGGETKETKSVKGWSVITLNPNTYSELGNYDSEERVMKVLDEIQKAMEYYNGGFGVYQMPEK